MADIPFDPRFPHIRCPSPRGSPDPTGSFIMNPVCKRCLLCRPNRLFCTTQSLRTHMIEWHRVGDDGARPFVCSICPKALRTYSQLTQHEHWHHELYMSRQRRIQKWVATKEKRGLKAAAMQAARDARHASKKANVKIFQCERCLRRFAQKGNLVHHQNACAKNAVPGMEQVRKRREEGRCKRGNAAHENKDDAQGENNKKPQRLLSIRGNRFGLSFEKPLPILKTSRRRQANDASKLVTTFEGLKIDEQVSIPTTRAASSSPFVQSAGQKSFNINNNSVVAAPKPSVGVLSVNGNSTPSFATSVKSQILSGQMKSKFGLVFQSAMPVLKISKDKERPSGASSRCVSYP
ncbi:hypothetical protein EDC01DRAFT_747530 [Geopyxis carbonaria]|nr:hypothetical protein EDC01DRAFT_747530 [Geopyxis carbonaria]